MDERGWRTTLAGDDEFGELLGAAQAGASHGFEVLYTRLAPAVTGYLRLQGAAEPDDLTSEVFLGVFAGIATFTGDEASFRSWIFTIAHRRLIDERRRNSRRRTEPSADDQVFDRPGGHAEQDALDAIGTRRVLELCAGLSLEQCEVIVLRVVADLTVGQVAEVVGKSVGAVKALQRRGLTALRERLVREGVPL